MDRIDDVTLLAHADGELDPETSRRLEQRITQHPELAAKVAGFREDAALLKAAFQHVLYQPPAADAFVHGVPQATHARQPEAPHGPSKRPALGWAMAAGLSALVVGGFAGQELAHRGQQAALRQVGVATPADQQAQDRALSVSLESSVSGTATPWRNPDTGHAGDVMPVRTFKAKNGQFCREFIETSKVFGTDQESGGVACRRADGAWKVRVRYFPDA
jgi:surface antigen